MPTNLFIDFLATSIKKPLHALSGGSVLMYAFSGYCGAACQSDAGDLEKMIKDFLRARDRRGEMALHFDIDSDDPNFNRCVEIGGQKRVVFKANDQYYVIG